MASLKDSDSVPGQQPHPTFSHNHSNLLHAKHGMGVVRNSQKKSGGRPTARISGEIFKRLMMERGDEEFQVPTNNDFEIDLTVLEGDALREKVLKIIHAQVPSWSDVGESDLKLDRMSGALTNCIFMVTAPPAAVGTVSEPRKILLRVYGIGVDQLFQREKEIGWLKLLSQLSIGARLLGIFKNGRLEQYLESKTLTKEDIRDSQTSRQLAHGLFELHNISKLFPPSMSDLHNLELWVNIEKWYPLAVKSVATILSRPTTASEQRRAIESLRLHDLKQELADFKVRLSKVVSPIVFAHNDTQYGNMLRLNRPPHELVVVDFEYAGYNPRGFDIANHFCEWMADYHSAEPHVLHFDRFPTAAEQHNFLRSYLEAKERITGSLEDEPTAAVAGDDKEVLLAAMECEVAVFIPASHALWGLWGLVQAANSAIDFDYLMYAAQRIEAFRRELVKTSV